MNKQGYIGKIEATKHLRKASGNVRIRSRLVSFLYQLMRDELPAGKVAKLFLDSQDPDVVYTNGYLARYAEYIAKGLSKK